MRASETFPAVMVTGPRQVGKTTMLERLADPSRICVSLDSPINREMAKNDPGLFLQRYQPPVLIDEFQYAKELLPFIKTYVDKHKRNGDFWLTGSQMFHMMAQVSESLAGRVAIVPMQGLSSGEIMGMTKAVGMQEAAREQETPRASESIRMPGAVETPSAAFRADPNEWVARLKTRQPMSLMQVYERIFKGSMPRVYSERPDREMFYGSYVDTYLRRDIRDITQVGDELAFLRLITACAARTGQKVTYTELARDAGVSPPTAKQWLSILVTSGIIVLVEPYFNNTLTRIVKSPKMYFMDTGLCAYLTRWDSAKTLEASMMSGAIFETYVVSEIIKSYYNAGKRPPVFYYRDTDQKEIDLIVEVGDTLHPFEIKKSAAPGKDSIRHFHVLGKTKKEIGAGGVICMADSVYPVDDKNYYIPAWLI